MFTQPVDNNWHPIPLIPQTRPRQVQRLTTVNSSTAVNSSALPVWAKMISLRPADFDCYVYFKDSAFSWSATNTDHHRFCPADQFTDIVLPDKPASTEQITLSILWKGAVSEFMIYVL